MNPDFEPKRQRSARPLEPLPDQSRARQEDRNLAPDILRDLEITRPEGLEAPTTPTVTRPSPRLRSAASHLRLNAIERALARVECDITCLDRAHRLPSLINNLAPTRAHEIARSLKAIVTPAAYGASIGVLPIAFSHLISQNTLVRGLGVLGGLGCAIIGLIGATERIKSERINYATALRPSARIRSFLIDLQSSEKSTDLWRRAITAKLETLHDRGLKLVCAREKIENDLLWRATKTI